MNPIAFVFDMDGVIVHSNPFHKIALRQFCEQHGHQLTEEQLREKIYGRTNKEWLTNIFGVLPPATLQQYAEEKEALYRELFKHDIAPLAGLSGFLQAMDEQAIERAIGTSAPRSNVDFTLSRTSLEKYFTIILDDRFVTHGKPHPEIYLKCADALQRKPADCIVFEDSLSGVEAGRQAGCKVVGISTTHTAAELKDTHWVMPDFTSLTPVALIKQLY
jgi:HAD superfamily hydrolase (TIGR01509 family)